MRPWQTVGYLDLCDGPGASRWRPYHPGKTCQVDLTAEKREEDEVLVKRRWEPTEVVLDQRLLISKRSAGYILSSVIVGMEGAGPAGTPLDTPLCDEQTAKNLAIALLKDYKVCVLRYTVAKAEELETEQQGNKPRNDVRSDVVAEAVKRLDAFPPFYRLLHVTGEKKEGRMTVTKVVTVQRVENRYRSKVRGSTGNK
jgi:hypothetical protein